MVLCKARQGTPYYALAHQFGISNGPAHSHCIRLRDLFNETVGKRLFYLQDADTVRDHLPSDWPARFRDTLLIGDGHPKTVKKSGIFVIQRITWSPYKHGNIFLWVICKHSQCGRHSLSTNHSLSVISPDGLIQMRSRVFGGQSAEVTTIINESDLLKRIRGEGWFGSIVPFCHMSSSCADMGYLQAEDEAEPIPVFMYDGAAGRADIGPQVSFVLPSERFKDGPQLEVIDFALFSGSNLT